MGSICIKKSLSLWLVLLFPLLGVNLAEGVATKLLTDATNKHNLSSNSSNNIKAALPGVDGTDEICVFCHTPHGASAQSTLWNRPDPGTLSFPLYNSATLVISGDHVSSPATATTNSQYGVDYPNGSSKMCLSCHDGNTAMIGEVLNAPKALGTSISMVIGTVTNLTVDLAASHPISFFYTGAMVTDINTAKGAGSYRLPLLADVRLDSEDRMQCTTCHDPHDDNRSKWAGNSLPFWRHSVTALNETSAYDDVCNDCHLTAASAAGHGL